MIVKNTTAAVVYLPIYQPETAHNALNAYVPASATVNLKSAGNATDADIQGSGILKSLIAAGTLVVIIGGVELTNAESVASFSIIDGTPNADRLITNFLDNASEVIPLTHAGHALTENFVNALSVLFSLEVDSVTTGGEIRAFKTDSGWATTMPKLSSATTPNEDLTYLITVGSGGALSLTLSGSGSGQSVAFKSITQTNYGI